MNNPSSILITGATGMVGSHLIDYLLQETRDHIYALIRWRSPLDNLRSALSSDPRLIINGSGN